MRTWMRWWMVLASAGALAACGGGGGGGDVDAGPRDAGIMTPDADDLCFGYTTCATEGERSCAGTTLTVCERNPLGCLVEVTTDCAASPGGACDTSGAMPMCVLPPDPCATIPAAERCDAAGTSCEGTNLTRCAPNAFGCLVRSTTDCASRAGGACDATGAVAACTATDACAGLTTCAAAGTRCEGPALVTCAPDAFGCLVESRTTCTDTMFGFCDPVGAPARCSTAATDPCMGVTECAAPGSASCASPTSLTSCAPNAFGCYVEGTTDCAATGDVCNASMGVASCVDPCSLVTTCPSATYCDGADVVTCAPDANGCLVESGRMACASGMCSADAGAAACVDTACPEAAMPVLDCASGTISANTMGGSTARAAYDGCSGIGALYDGAERIFRFRHTGANPVAVRIVATRGASTADFDLYAWSAGDGTTSCTEAALTCLDASTGTTATETVEFAAASGSTSYVAYDVYDDATATTDFTLAITCTPIVCGDGVASGPETCDDGNTTAGDGCSATCSTEPSYACTGAPSVCTSTCGNGVRDGMTGETCDDGNRTAGDGCSPLCVTEAGYSCTGVGAGSCIPQAANATCTGAIALTGGRTGDNVRAGGARPSGTGCNSLATGPVLYYSVTVPANSDTTVTATPTAAVAWDPILRSLDSCAATACLAVVDAAGMGAAERIVLRNTSSAPITRIVAVGSYSATTVGAVDLAISSSPLPFTSIPLACVDTSAGTNLMFTSTDDAVSATAALPFTFTLLGTPMTHFSVSTNGNVQLFASAAGTASDQWTNATIPTAAVPNGFIAPFWDDLGVAGAGTYVRTLTSGTAGSRVFTIEWRVNATSSGTSPVIVFQARLFEGTNVAEVHHCSFTGTGTSPNGRTATIGIENVDGTAGRLVGFDTAGTVTFGTSAYRFTP